MSSTDHRKSLFRALLCLSGLGLAGIVQAQSCAVGETSSAFGFTGAEQTATVPPGVHSLTVYLSGAQGGAGRSGAGSIGGSPNSPGGAGGLGSRVRGKLTVTPGSTLSIWVGGQGSQAINAGGLGQGVDGIGGGATDIRVGGDAVGNRVAIAGGGGGGGNAGWSTSSVIAGGAGGSGGAGSGGAGADVPGGVGPFGGGGGSSLSGGTAGAGCGSFPATAGNPATGKGGNSNNFSGSFVGAGYGGGGGGGADIGPGGGGAGVGTTGCQQNWNGGGGGGAGGSSNASGLNTVTINGGIQAGNGAALLCFAPSNFAVGGSMSGQSGPVTLQLTASNPVSSQQLVVAQSASTFVFATLLPQGANWTVSTISAPAGQQCSVNPSSGVAINADVSNVVVSCVTVSVVISPSTLPNGTFNTSYSQALAASSPNGGTAPYAFVVSAGSVPPGLTLSNAGVLSGTPTTTGSFNFTAQATSSNGFSGSQAYSLAIAQGAQTITGFTANPPAPTYAAGGSFTVSANGGGSGNPVVFASSTPATCSVAGSTVTTLAAGSCTVTADQAGNANYLSAAQVQLTVSIAVAPQTLTFPAQTPASHIFVPGGSFAINPLASSATPNSGNAILYTSLTAAVCTVGGTTVSIVSAGTCTIAADQSGDANYAAAPQVTQTIAIGLAPQTLMFAAQTPATQTFVAGGSFPIDPQATSAAPNSGNPILYSSQTSAVCTVSGTTVSIVAAGTCTIAADQSGDANYAAAPQVTQTIAIGVASQTIAGFTATPANPTFTPGGTFTVAATGGASGNPVTFSIAPASAGVCSAGGTNGATITMLSVGTCTVQADQAGNGSYAAATQMTLAVVLNQTRATITLTSSVNPSAFGSPVTFTATVAAAVSPTGIALVEGDARARSVSAKGSAQAIAALATGTVSFSDGGTLFGTTPLVGGTATVTTAFAVPGGHLITASYSGDAVTAAASATLVQQVGAPGPIPSAPALSSWMLTLLAGLIGWNAVARLRAKRKQDQNE